MKQYWKHYLKTTGIVVLCYAGLFLLDAIQNDMSFDFFYFLFWPWSLLFAVLSLPGSSLYLRQKGVPGGWRVLFFFLNPALYHLAFFVLMAIAFSTGFNPGPGI